MTTGKIDMASIEKKVRAWEKSAAGQDRIRKKVNGYVLRNVDKTEAGSVVVTRKKMIELADKLVETVRNNAAGAGLPESVMSAVESLHRGAVTVNPDGGFQIEMNFTGDLSRPSLEPNKYGDLENIIVIFNNGYPQSAGRAEAISHVAGYWHGEYTHALGSRPGLYFLQSAVNDFNATYGSQYNIFAELGDPYDSE